MSLRSQQSAAEQGRQAARTWIAGSAFAEQPANPFPRPNTADAWKEPSDFMRWNHGFDAVCYREWGNVDADAARAERRAGC